MNQIKYLALLVVGQMIINICVYFQSKFVPQTTIWNITKYNLVCIPIILIGNIIIMIAFGKGISELGSVWQVNLLSWSAIVIATVLLSILLFHHIPKTNVLIGLFVVLVGVVIASYK